MTKASVNVHFSDFFEVDPTALDEYGAFNTSLINDLPLFIDPFLIFNSPKSEYQRLHNGIIQYLRFLRDKSRQGEIDNGLLKAWFYFREVKQSWLGFSETGNSGSGLGKDFARALSESLGSIFTNFGEEKITKGSHLEKLCLVKEGVGKDNISDFTTNLIKEYLVEYTQAFAVEHIKPEFRRQVAVNKVRFNYDTETWVPGLYDLPYFADDYIILVPKDMLTKEDIWISRNDLYSNFQDIAESIPDDQLRSQINNYFYMVLAENPTEKEETQAINSAIRQFPQIIEYYIRLKEEAGNEATTFSDQMVSETERLFVSQVEEFVASLAESTPFYKVASNTYREALERIYFFKSFVENMDGYRLFYLDAIPIKREEELQLLYRLTWYASISDVNREVNNGRGPVDFKISRGNKDKTLVEFKLASNSQLKRNLQNQVPIYEKANDTKQSIKVILFFSQTEYEKVIRILIELGLENQENVVLIDARSDNKPSASKA